MLKRTLIAALIMLVASIGIYALIPESKLPGNCVITKLVVLKSKRQLLVYSNTELLKTYTVSLGGSPVGKKEFENDGKTPEGFYFINAKNPKSAAHKNLGISYPNHNDIEKARKAGLQVGGDIKIHGIMNGYGFIGKLQRQYDWTRGCIALTNNEIDDLYKHTAIGVPIEIRP